MKSKLSLRKPIHSIDLGELNQEFIDNLKTEFKLKCIMFNKEIYESKEERAVFLTFIKNFEDEHIGINYGLCEFRYFHEGSPSAPYIIASMKMLEKIPVSNRFFNKDNYSPMNETEYGEEYPKKHKLVINRFTSGEFMGDDDCNYYGQNTAPMENTNSFCLGNQGAKLRALRFKSKDTQVIYSIFNLLEEQQKAEGDGPAWNDDDVVEYEENFELTYNNDKEFKKLIDDNLKKLKDGQELYIQSLMSESAEGGWIVA